MTNKNLSIVIPCFNEEETIMDTYKVLRKLINNWDNFYCCNNFVQRWFGRGSRENI